MSRKKMSMRQSMRWHTKWNLRDRYGIFCNGDLYKYIVAKIIHGESECILTQSNTRSWHKIFVPVSELHDERTNIKVDIVDDCVKLYVIYDRSRRELHTALPWFSTDDELMRDYFENHVYVKGD